MQKSPLVTVICLCYNHNAFVIESLSSVLNQNYSNLELLIVDDCSHDDSKQTIENWLKLHPTIRFISNKTNLGNTKSFNQAAKFAKGEYIIDLAADDILLPHCIEKQLEKFEKSNYKNLAIVYGNAELIDEKGKHISNYFAVDENKKVITKRITGDIYSSILAGGDSICSVSSMMKKSVFDVLNGYDENLAYEDLDYWIRASRKYDFDFIDEILIQKRVLKSAMTADFYKKNNKLNYSAYLILKKAMQLNKTKFEDLSLQKRVHNGILHAIKIKDLKLLFLYLKLKMKLSFRLLFR